MSEHTTAIHPPMVPTGTYWWSCVCGDEGGPHDSYNEAWDATVRHLSERRPESPTRGHMWDGQRDRLTVDYEEYKALIYVVRVAQTFLTSQYDAEHWRGKLAEAVDEWERAYSLTKSGKAAAERSDAAPEGSAP